ncbi:MAG TPA: MerR family transcriptional regulator, partial [Arthrobacter sp.]
YSYKEVEEKSGVKAATLRVWHNRGKLPEPDFTVGQSPAWKPETIQPWIRAQRKAAKAAAAAAAAPAVKA